NLETALRAGDPLGGSSARGIGIVATAAIPRRLGGQPSRTRRVRATRTTSLATATARATQCILRRSAPRASRYLEAAPLTPNAAARTASIPTGNAGAGRSVQRTIPTAAATRYPEPTMAAAPRVRSTPDGRASSTWSAAAGR